MAEISRADALALLSTQNIHEIIQEATSSSAAFRSFRRLTMTKGTARLPVLSALPTAGFVTEVLDSTGIKPTSDVQWENKDLIAEEIAVIIPVHENVIDDADFDIFGEVRPLVAQELGRVLDAAVFFGTNKPATWTDDALIPGAIAAGNEWVSGSGTIGDLAEDFNEAFALVEDDGFDVNHVYTGRFLRSRLRGLRDLDNQPIYLDNIRSDGRVGSIYGEDLDYVTNGAWDRDEAVALVGDASKAILGIRQDVQVKILDQATVGSLNLAERDMVALRFKFRIAFAVANPITTDGDDSDPYPFAVITPAGS